MRVHPFDLLFADFRSERFPAIRTSLDANDDVNQFVLAAPALELLRELRPDEGFGERVDDFVAFVHAAYLFWRDGERTLALAEADTRALAAGSRSPSPAPTADHGLTKYVQIAPRLIWGQLDDDAPFEPLDGWFLLPRRDELLRMVGCFGVHENRPGLSVVAVRGSPPGVALRQDGTAPFAPTMPGGDAAELLAVASTEELLLLGWRTPPGLEV